MRITLTHTHIGWAICLPAVLRADRVAPDTERRWRGIIDEGEGSPRGSGRSTGERRTIAAACRRARPRRGVRRAGGLLCWAASRRPSYLLCGGLGSNHNFFAIADVSKKNEKN